MQTCEHEVRTKWNTTDACNTRMSCCCTATNTCPHWHVNGLPVLASIIALIYWCIYVLQCYCIFVLMYWCIDILMYWRIDVLTYWCIFVLIYWCIDALMYWYTDVLMYWMYLYCRGSSLSRKEPQWDGDVRLLVSDFKKILTQTCQRCRRRSDRSHQIPITIQNCLLVEIVSAQSAPGYHLPHSPYHHMINIHICINVSL